LAALRRKVDPADREAVAQVARQADIQLVATPDGLRVSLDGEPVGESIRTPEISALTSRLTANSPGVREELVRRQRELGRQGGVVMEGRDITTVVFPKAQLKVYLDCSVEERVRRRSLQFTQQGIAFDAAGLRGQIQRRDEEDMRRPIGALRLAPGTVKVLSDGKTPEAIVEEIVGHLPAGAHPA
jgi:cytidylate kinase